MSEKLSRTLVTFSAFWAAFGLVSGVAFRELSRNFVGDTGVLGLVHGHTLVLGMFFMLIVLLLVRHFDLASLKSFTAFLYTWNIGLLITVVMLLTNGLRTIWGYDHHAALAGISGIGHILLSVGIVLFFRSLFVVVRMSEKAENAA